VVSERLFPMVSILGRRLIVVTGKGGAGKSTIAGAVGLLGSWAGLQTLIVDVDGSNGALARLFGAERLVAPGVEVELAPGLWSTSIDQDQALQEWLQAVGGRVPGRVLASRSSFQYFAAAAPGARELVSMVKIWSLTSAARSRAGGGHDLVVLDAPATGHALAMLGSPLTFARIARSGPIASQAHEVGELLSDPGSTGFLAVARCTEMSIAETLDLREGLSDQLGRELDGVALNGLIPRRFTRAELDQIEALEATGGWSKADVGAVQAAISAARTAHARAGSQEAQLGRLRKRGLRVARIPFVFRSRLDLDSLGRIAGHLQRGLGM
jgi:anion-transporting  ArsA/GET3 family ATPase